MTVEQWTLIVASIGTLATLCYLSLYWSDRESAKPRLQIDILADDPLEEGPLREVFKGQTWSHSKGQTFLRVEVKNLSKEPDTIISTYLVRENLEDMNGPRNVVLSQNEQTAYLYPWELAIESGAKEVLIRSTRMGDLRRRIPGR